MLLVAFLSGGVSYCIIAIMGFNAFWNSFWNAFFVGKIMLYCWVEGMNMMGFYDGLRGCRFVD